MGEERGTKELTYRVKGLCNLLQNNPYHPNKTMHFVSLPGNVTNKYIFISFQCTEEIKQGCGTLLCLYKLLGILEICAILGQRRN